MEMRGIDPLGGKVDELHRALTTATGHAEGAGGRVTVDCTADGLIRNWHIDEVLVNNVKIRDVVSLVVRLQHEAVERAREAARHIADDVSTYPRLTHLASTFSEDSLGPSVEPVVKQHDEARQTQIFEDPIRRPRRNFEQP